MAVVKQSLQVLSGKIGNVVYKRRGNTNYIATMPSKYTKSESLAAKNARDRFKVLGKFSKYLLSSPVLKEIWKNSGLNGIYSYHKILKANSPLLDGQNLSVNNMIAPKTPENPVKVLSLSQTELLLTLNDYIFPAKATDFQLNIILAFFAPKNERSSPFQFAFVKSDAQPGSLNYTFQLPPTAVNFIAEFERVIIYTALSFTKSKKVSWYCNKGSLFLTSEIG
ncbi:MAG: hypothetical protein AB9882_04325 [Ignavibacteriaceae bacterium]